MRKEIRIAGFGGQGVITIGIMLARAAGEQGGMYVAQSQSYGPEARGGACKTDVVLSEAPIDYIKMLDLRTMLVMSQPAFDKYAAPLPDDALLILDSTLVTTVPARFTNVHSVEATAIAEAMQLKVAANVVMFGALVRLTQWVTRAQAEKTLELQLPPKVLGKNMDAFAKGYDALL